MALDDSCNNGEEQGYALHLNPNETREEFLFYCKVSERYPGCPYLDLEADVIENGKQKRVRACIYSPVPAIRDILSLSRIIKSCADIDPTNYSPEIDFNEERKCGRCPIPGLIPPEGIHVRPSKD